MQTRAASTCLMMNLASYSGMYLVFFMNSESSGPEQISSTVATVQWSSISITQQRAAMLGCFSYFWILYSLTMCFMYSCLEAKEQDSEGNDNFIATSSHFYRSKHRQTSLKPPLPSNSRVMYLSAMRGQLPRENLLFSSSLARLKAAMYATFSSLSLCRSQVHLSLSFLIILSLNSKTDRQFGSPEPEIPLCRSPITLSISTNFSLTFRKSQPSTNSYLYFSSFMRPRFFRGFTFQDLLLAYTLWQFSTMMFLSLRLYVSASFCACRISPSSLHFLFNTSSFWAAFSSYNFWRMAIC